MFEEECKLHEPLVKTTVSVDEFWVHDLKNFVDRDVDFNPVLLISQRKQVSRLNLDRLLCQTESWLFLKNELYPSKQNIVAHFQVARDQSEVQVWVLLLTKPVSYRSVDKQVPILGNLLIFVDHVGTCK